jgi:hypothetical protein
MIMNESWMQETLAALLTLLETATAFQFDHVLSTEMDIFSIATKL